MEKNSYQKNYLHRLFEIFDIDYILPEKVLFLVFKRRMKQSVK